MLLKTGRVKIEGSRSIMFQASTTTKGRRIEGISRLTRLRPCGFHVSELRGCAFGAADEIDEARVEGQVLFIHCQIDGGTSECGIDVAIHSVVGAGVSRPRS